MTASRRYKLRRLETPQIGTTETSEIIDSRFRFEIQTKEFVKPFVLGNTISPVLSIPLNYNEEKQAFEIGVKPTSVESYMYGKYFGESLPTETVPGDYRLAVDAQHRLYVIDDQALAKLDKLLNSIGDAGSSPINTEGETVLRRLADIEEWLYTLRSSVGYRLPPTLLTSTPLGANATYTSNPLDFTEVRAGYFIAGAYANQPGTLFVEQSIDGSNWDVVESTSVNANEGVALKVPIVGRYVRVWYVNGPTAQTVFRLWYRVSIA